MASWEDALREVVRTRGAALLRYAFLLTLVGSVTVTNISDKRVKGHTEIPDVAVARDGHIVVTPGPKRQPALGVDLKPGETKDFSAGVVLVRCSPGGGSPETEVTTVDGKRVPVATLGAWRVPDLRVPALLPGRPNQYR